MVRRNHWALALREWQGASNDLCILAGASMRIEPHWQCTNCRTHNHYSQTYCPECYELAPAAHTITPAKFGPDTTIEPFGRIEFATAAQPANCREYKRLVWARRKDDSSIDRG